MIRRDFLKGCGLLAAGTALSDPFAMASEIISSHPDNTGDVDLFTPDGRIRTDIRSLEPSTGKQVTAIVIGAGNRGRVYANYAKRFPEHLKIVGVSDILESRRLDMARKHDIPEENRFGHYREVFTRPKMADAVIISTPDNCHYEPCLKALELGYDVLLEKPMAQTEQECKDILAATRKYKRIVAVCHVLRYAPYFIALKKVVESGAIGELVSIQHYEPVRFAHMAHSFVRGNWRDSKQTTPMIIAKSCHDLDIIRWIIDKPCETISADGYLHLFKKENTPEGAPYRCTDGCPHQDTCPYSAIDIYVKRKLHLGVFDLKNKKDEDEIMEKIRTTPYGRCVYQCDNDQPDHYVATMTFEGGKTASFNMEAFAPIHGRRTRLMGTMGYIEGDMKKFTLWDFKTGSKKVWSMEVEEIEEYKGSGHGGGDHALLRDFIEAVALQDENRLSSAIDVSIESHVMGFAAEKSRNTMKKSKVEI